MRLAAGADVPALKSVQLVSSSSSINAGTAPDGAPAGWGTKKVGGVSNMRWQGGPPVAVNAAVDLRQRRRAGPAGAGPVDRGTR